MTQVIELRGVHKHYAKGDLAVHALRGVSLTITRGESVAIMGASGSGKSTLMHILGCFTELSEGSYRLDGVDVASLDDDGHARLRNRKLGFVFQDFHLLPRNTALENVEAPMLCAGGRPNPHDVQARALECLSQVGLIGRSEHFPNQLSGGQQQRVAIARALVGKPEVILADEPTGNLDTRTSMEIMALLQELNDQGVTTVIVTHELDIARCCRRLIVLRDGRVMQDTAVRDRISALQELDKLPLTELPAPDLQSNGS